MSSPNRPDWLPAHVPELDGLRGLAVLAVFTYHARARLHGTCLAGPAEWGWTGVTLFFVLSGFLITANLLQHRHRSAHFFRDFYARRGLRILPLYLLLIAACYLGPAWMRVSSPVGAAPKKTLLALLLFVQNLSIAKLGGGLVPTWSIAIEEQYYLAWAPVVRFLEAPAVLCAGVLGVLAGSPVFRMYFAPRLSPTNTFLHLDGIALGSLLALALYHCHWRRSLWVAGGTVMLVVGLGATMRMAGNGPWKDSSVALACAGLVLSSIGVSGQRSAWLLALRRGPLPFYGRISYGLYLVHLLVFMSLGPMYTLLDRTMPRTGWLISLAVVLTQLLVSTVLAALLWHFVERPVLRLKRRFES